MFLINYNGLSIQRQIHATEFIAGITFTFMLRGSLLVVRN